MPALQPGATAQSLICNICQKKFRSTAQAEYHAGKTEHTDFSESTEEVKPLSKEEIDAKLAELKVKAAARKAAAGDEDKEARKKNEEIRRKATKESQDIKEDMARREQIKEAQKKRAEKKADDDARKATLAKIEADKQERRRKAEVEKAAREGRAVEQQAEAPVVVSSATASGKKAADYTETRLRLQGPSGNIMKTVSVDTTLFELADQISGEVGHEVESFSTTFPKKTYDRTDFGLTLKEAKLVPSASLIIK